MTEEERKDVLGPYRTISWLPQPSAHTPAWNPSSVKKKKLKIIFYHCTSIKANTIQIGYHFPFSFWFKRMSPLNIAGLQHWAHSACGCFGPGTTSPDCSTAQFRLPGDWPLFSLSNRAEERGGHSESLAFLSTYFPFSLSVFLALWLYSWGAHVLGTHP